MDTRSKGKPFGMNEKDGERAAAGYEEIAEDCSFFDALLCHRRRAQSIAGRRQKGYTHEIAAVHLCPSRCHGDLMLYSDDDDGEILYHLSICLFNCDVEIRIQ